MVAVDSECFNTGRKHHFAAVYYPTQSHVIADNEVYCCRGLHVACLHLQSGEVTITRNYVYGGETGIYVGENSRATLTQNISYDHSLVAGMIVGTGAFLRNNEWYSPVEGGAIRTMAGVPAVGSPKAKASSDFANGNEVGGGKDIVGANYHNRLPANHSPVYSNDLPSENGGVMSIRTLNSLNKLCANIGASQPAGFSGAVAVAATANTDGSPGTPDDKYASATFPPMLRWLFQQLFQFTLPHPGSRGFEASASSATPQPSSWCYERAFASVQPVVPSTIEANTSTVTLQSINANSNGIFARQVKLFSLEKMQHQVRLEYIRQAVNSISHVKRIGSSDGVRLGGGLGGHGDNHHEGGGMSQSSTDHDNASDDGHGGGGVSNASGSRKRGGVGTKGGRKAAAKAAATRKPAGRAVTSPAGRHQDAAASSPDGKDAKGSQKILPALPGASLPASPSVKGSPTVPRPPKSKAPKKRGASVKR